MRPAPTAASLKPPAGKSAIKVRVAFLLAPQFTLTAFAALVPPPRTHRHRYYGVLAPNAPLRAAVTALAPAPPVDFDQRITW